jgi:hypothetical protein
MGRKESKFICTLQKNKKITQSILTNVLVAKQLFVQRALIEFTAK